MHERYVTSGLAGLPYGNTQVGYQIRRKWTTSPPMDEDKVDDYLDSYRANDLYIEHEIWRKDV